MERFHLIEDAAAILVSRGVYKQVKVYRRGTALFAAYGGGFIRLYEKGGTSLAAIKIDALDVGEAKTVVESFGKLALAAE